MLLPVFAECGKSQSRSSSFSNELLPTSSRQRLDIGNREIIAKYTTVGTVGQVGRVTPCAPSSIWPSPARTE